MRQVQVDYSTVPVLCFVGCNQNSIVMVVLFYYYDASAQRSHRHSLHQSMRQVQVDYSTIPVLRFVGCNQSGIVKAILFITVMLLPSEVIDIEGMYITTG